MKNIHVLFEQDEHRWTVLHRDPDKNPDILDTNEYLISNQKKHLLCDPGGLAVFPSVLSSLVKLIEPAEVEAIFASHQDPDIASSLSLWLRINQNIKCYASQLWTTFIPHFGGEADTFIPIDDKGMKIKLGNLTLQAVPAHHMHSAGNFHLYDPKAKIYFSGDTGAAFLPHDNRYLFVEDFDAHIPYIEGFHRRWFGSNEHKNEWCERVAELDIELFCPQHGAIYRSDMVKRFIDWLYRLNVGTTSNMGVKL